MQAPIDIEHSEKLRIDDLRVKYQPADLDILNDCNEYRILLKFPDNYWLTVGKKPYFLTELHFREPGENAVNGKRPKDQSHGPAAGRPQLLPVSRIAHHPNLQ
jgi:carbonic anhydrase